MKHIKIYENWEDDFLSGGKKPDQKYRKPISVLGDAIMDAALLFRNFPGDKNEDVALILSETARLLTNDPIKLSEILQKIDDKREELEAISEIWNDKGSSWTPEGISVEGFNEINIISNTMINEPDRVRDALGIPSGSVYSMGVLLYYICLSILDDDMFNYVQECYDLI